MAHIEGASLQGIIAHIVCCLLAMFITGLLRKVFLVYLVDMGPDQW